MGLKGENTVENRESRAYLRQLRVTPRKVKIVLDLIRGKDVAKAFAILKNTNKLVCEDIEKLLSMNPEDENALLLKAEILATSGEDANALKLIEQVLALNPFNEKAYLLKGSYFLSKQAFDEAIAVYDEALEISPNFAQAYHERGRVKLAKGDKQGSMEDMKRAIELSPENGANISGEYNNYEQQKNIPF